MSVFLSKSEVTATFNKYLNSNVKISAEFSSSVIYNSELMNKIISQLNDVSDVALSEFLKFNGFDQEEVYRLAVSNFTLTELTLLIMLTMYKGTSALDPQKNDGKQFNTLSSFAQEFIKSIWKKVNDNNIPFSASGKSNPITLPRLVITFPNIAIGVMIKMKKPHFVTSITIPYPFAFPGAAGLFPRAGKKDQFESYINWSIEVDRVINGAKADAAKVRRFAELGRENGKMPDVEREKFLTQFWNKNFMPEVELVPVTPSPVPIESEQIQQPGKKKQQKN
jgi:hypothetical protein